MNICKIYTVVCYKYKSIHVVICIGVTYKTGYELVIGFIDILYIHANRDYRQCSLIAILHAFSSPLHTV
jgi:hypothetical protein